jgi:hypothetical protein
MMTMMMIIIIIIGGNDTQKENVTTTIFASSPRWYRERQVGGKVHSWRATEVHYGKVLIKLRE